LISEEFQPSTGAEPPWKEKNLNPPRQIPEYALGWNRRGGRTYKKDNSRYRGIIKLYYIYSGLHAQD